MGDTFVRLSRRHCTERCGGVVKHTERAEGASGLTASQLEDLPYEHEAGLGQGVLPPVRIVAVVRVVAVVIRLLLGRGHAHTQQVSSHTNIRTAHTRHTFTKLAHTRHTHTHTHI